MKLLLTSISFTTVLLYATIMPANAAAAGTSTLSLQLSGNTINVYETSNAAVNTVEADFSYTGLNNVQSIGVATSSTFATCLSSTSASIVCSALGGNITGTHLVAILTITTSNNTSSATVTASVVDSSMILASSDSTDTLDHSALPSVTYNYTPPAPTPTPPAPSSNPTPSASNSSTTTEHMNVSSPTVNGASTNQPATQSSDNKPQATAPHVVSSKATKQPWHTVAAWSSSSILVLALLAGTVFWILHNRTHQQAALATAATRPRTGINKRAKRSTHKKA